MKHYGLKQLSILADYHLRYYRERLKRDAYYLEINEKPSIKPDQKYRYLIACSLESLSEEERRILEAEYLELKGKNWWMEYYSKSTYYRIKYRALTRFIHCLHRANVV